MLYTIPQSKTTLTQSFVLKMNLVVYITFFSWILDNDGIDYWFLTHFVFWVTSLVKSFDFWEFSSSRKNPIKNS